MDPAHGKAPPTEITKFGRCPRRRSLPPQQYATPSRKRYILRATIKDRALNNRIGHVNRYIIFADCIQPLYDVLKSASSNLIPLKSLPRCVFSIPLPSRRTFISKARMKGTGDCFRPHSPAGGSIKPSAWTCCPRFTIDVRNNPRKSHISWYSVRERR